MIELSRRRKVQIVLTGFMGFDAWSRIGIITSDNENQGNFVAEMVLL